MKHSILRRAFLGFGLSMVALIATLLASSHLSASSGGGGQGILGDNNRGDNPVVGSLPCRKDPYLEPMFWSALYDEDPPMDLFGFQPTLGFVGENLLEDILAAAGDPEGRVDAWPNLNVFGVHKWASVFLSTEAVKKGQVGLWYWVPREYIGGTVSFVSTFGSGEAVISDQAFLLPLRAFASRCSSSFGVAKIVFHPPARSVGLDVREVLIAVAGITVNVQHLP